MSEILPEHLVEMLKIGKRFDSPGRVVRVGVPESLGWTDIPDHDGEIFNVTIEDIIDTLEKVLAGKIKIVTEELSKVTYERNAIKSLSKRPIHDAEHMKALLKVNVCGACRNRLDASWKCNGCEIHEAIHKGRR